CSSGSARKPERPSSAPRTSRDSAAPPPSTAGTCSSRCSSRRRRCAWRCRRPGPIRQRSPLTCAPSCAATGSTSQPWHPWASTSTSFANAPKKPSARTRSSRPAADGATCPSRRTPGRRSSSRSAKRSGSSRGPSAALTSCSACSTRTTPVATRSSGLTSTPRGCARRWTRKPAPP
ncbi:MAG: hypothetical protein AVDCRST_MAG47-1172, partial [uncultured Nocardioidaceae bacterium]